VGAASAATRASAAKLIRGASKPLIDGLRFASPVLPQTDSPRNSRNTVTVSSAVSRAHAGGGEYRRDAIGASFWNPKFIKGFSRLGTTS
jgi:hypothetical protein